MHAIRRAWLVLCWVRLPLAIRIPNGTDQCRGGAELRKVQEIERAERELWESFQKNLQEGAFAQVDPRRLQLNGQQWCERPDRLPTTTLQGRVAMILMGQPFRSRNYLSYGESRASCTEGTVSVQKKLVKNHLDMVVMPIEWKLGKQVDVFLTDTPCSQVKYHKFRVYQPMQTSLNSLGLLKEWYGLWRVKGVAQAAVEDNMYERMAKMFSMAAEYMKRQGGMYEYFVFSRYDLYFDKPFTSAYPGRTLNFYTFAHDFFFAFPREMFGCMQGLFTDCLAEIEWKQGRGSESDRRQRGCFTFGPLELPKWNGGFGYIMLMMALQHVLKEASPKLVSIHGLQKTGTSAFDVMGREHRCTGSWYWPPRNKMENRSMPCYFHVG